MAPSSSSRIDDRTYRHNPQPPISTRSRSQQLDLLIQLTKERQHLNQTSSTTNLQRRQMKLRQSNLHQLATASVS